MLGYRRSRSGTLGLALLCSWDGAAQYASCNGTVADIGNGRCDAELNVPACGYDSGDCCPCTCLDGRAHACSDNEFDCLYPVCPDPADVSEETACTEEWKNDGFCDSVNNKLSCNFDGGDCCACSCIDSAEFACGSNDFACLDPACFDPALVAEFPDCPGDWLLIGNGDCDNAETNNSLCNWDGGDCCLCECTGGSCSTSAFNCLDPSAGEEFFECKAPPPSTLPCSSEAQREWVVQTSAQAEVLAAAVNCSGGSFEVEWRGNVIVGEPIYVGGGTVLSITGDGTGAVIDGNDTTRLFTVVNAVLHLSSLNISNGASITGGAIAATRSSLTFNRTNIVGNAATGHGGGVYVSGGSIVSCVGGGIFADNEASIDGGAMFVTGGSMVSCGGSWLSNVAGDTGGALVLYEGSSVSWDDDAMFAYNVAGRTGGAVSLANGSNVSWGTETTFFSNRAGIFGGAVAILSTSTASWNGVTSYEDNTVGDLGYGGAMYISTNSTVSWSASTIFFGNKAGYQGGAVIVVADSTLSWRGVDTLFEGNQAGRWGGAVMVSASSYVFSATEAITTFSNNSADRLGNGGAVFVESESRVFFDGSLSFVANSGPSGGAIFTQNGSIVSWAGETIFSSNEALADGGVVGSSALDSVTNPHNSTLIINGPTTFFNNTCGANGGALAMLGGLSVRIGVAGVVFSHNTAAVAGGAVFVSGTGFGPTFPDVSFEFNSAQVGGAISAVGSGNLKENADTEQPNPTRFDRCRFSGNLATATGGAIESASGQDVFVDSVFEGNKAGVGGALRLAGTASVDNCSFVENVSDDGGGAAVSNIGSILKMANISFSNNLFDCQPSMFLEFNAPGHPYDVVCDGCNTACDGCSFEEPSRVPTCSEVMAHATSAGGSITLEAISIEPGYWRASPSSRYILSCYYADACLGGVTGAADFCLEGYQGPYCSICMDGYTTQLGYTCSKCSNSAGGIVLAIVLVVAALCVVAAVVSYVMSGKVGGRERGMVERVGRYIPIQSVKIVIVAWQILTQFTSVANITYPSAYQHFLDGLDVFNFDLGWVLSAGCVVDVDFHGRLLILTISPIFALVLLGGTYAAAVHVYRGSPETLQIVWNKLLSMMLLLTFFVYSSVSSTLFQSFACEELEDGKNYLRADYRIECDSSKHRAFQVYAGLMIILYSVGIPTFYGVLLYRDRDVLKQDEAEREETTRVTSISDLWKPYKPSVFYYEVIECSRRVVLAGVVVFIYPNTAAQIAVTLMMAVVFAMLAEGLAPYVSRWDTWISRMGHAVVTVSMYVALLLKVDVSDERSSSQRMFEAVLVSVHACMVLAVVVETMFVACSLRIEQREESSPRFHGGKFVFRGQERVTSAEINPFSTHVYRTERD